MKKILAGVVFLLIGAVFVLMVAEMPAFGSPCPVDPGVSRYYLENALADTGAINSVSAIVLDYRSSDALGAVAVLFAGLTAVAATLIAHSRKEGR
jgi:multicomponent Na+:H+ antiporter subunit B